MSWPGRVRPERCRRGDVVAAVVLVVTLVVGAAVLWRFSAAANTVSVTVDPSRPAPVLPPEPGAVPTGFVEAWRAPSAATPMPVLVGSVVVTGDGSSVTGRDAATGAERWRYARDLPLCTIAAGFPDADGGRGRALAAFANGAYCSELTAFDPDTGARTEQRNPEVGLGTRLLEHRRFLTATGSDYLEVFRSDLVKTLEYGAVRAPEQPGRQPRNGCRYGSFAVTADRLAVVERCPGETVDRVTVLHPDPDDGPDRPMEEFSVPLPVAGATLVAVSADRVAVALPGPPRLAVLDGSGAQLTMIALDLPSSDLGGDPPGRVSVVAADPNRLYWWTGSSTVALGRDDLVPRWTLPDTIGPGTTYAGRLLVPVRDGLVELDTDRGAAVRTIPVDRGGAVGPVRSAAAGGMLLEQRGGELVALVPADQ